MCHSEVPAGQLTPEVESREVVIPVGWANMPALLARPGSARPGSAVTASVLVVSDIFGRSPFYENLGARLAAAGFQALVPEIFFRQGPLPERTMDAAVARRAQLDENQTQRDLLAAVDWLRTRQSGPRVGTIGFCMGGTHTLDLAARRDDLVTVTFYGYPARLPEATERTAPAPLEVAGKMRGPILGFWGDQDQLAGLENVEMLRTVLTQRGLDFDLTVYPGLGHGFMAASGFDPGHIAYEAACDAWDRTVAFLQAHLAGGEAPG